jgi:hypothetical protein
VPNIRINSDLKWLIDWGCSLRPDADVPFITKASLKKHATTPVVVEDFAKFTTSGKCPVTFPEIPQDMDVKQFRAILASYLLDAFNRWCQSKPLELEKVGNYKLEDVKWPVQ